jgi:radical SAM superfamily enzyme YgiQ (UPF0313 family)
MPTLTTRVVFISLFDTGAFGIRQIAAMLKAGGYYTNLIFLKRMKAKPPGLELREYQAPATAEVATNTEKELVLDLLQELMPDIVGISLRSSFYKLAVELTTKIRTKLQVPIVWGGIHPTVVPDTCIKHADFICIGEGELAMLELANRLAHTMDITNIDGFWVNTRRLNTYGLCGEKKGQYAVRKIYRNPVRPPIEDLDALPYPDFDGKKNKYFIDDNDVYRMPLTKYGNPSDTPEMIAYEMMTARGCPYSCTFCSNTCLRKLYAGKGRYLRRRSVNSVIAELKHIKSRNKYLRRIEFWDEIFTLDRKWVEAFSDAYREHINLRFYCYTHPNVVKDELIQPLKRAGLTSINMGIQSGSERVRREIFNRQMSNAKIIAAANTLLKYNLAHYVYDLIVDNPFETDDDLQETLELLLQLPRPFVLNLFSLAYFPETPLTERALKEGYITDADIEGISSKAAMEYIASMSYTRPRRARFWNMMFALTPLAIIPRPIHRLMGKIKLLRQHPTAVYNIIKFLARVRGFHKLSS